MGDTAPSTSRTRGSRGFAVSAACSLAAVAILVAGCGGDDRNGKEEADRVDRAGAEVEASAALDSVTVVFTREERPNPVRRPTVPGATPGNDEARLRRALGWLLQGPTEDERAAGIDSWFSDATADALRAATLDESGHAVVDLADLRRIIPGASSSAGSEMLLAELNGTVFGVSGVGSVEYRMDGSCARFWAWLQRVCEVVERP